MKKNAVFLSNPLSSILFAGMVFLSNPSPSLAASSSSKSKKQAYSTVKKAFSGIIKSSLKISANEIKNSTIKYYSPFSASGNSNSSNLITRTISKTVSCSNSGSITLISNEVIDKSQKAVSFDGSLQLNNCNSFSGNAVCSLDAMLASSGSSFAFAIPTAALSGKLNNCGGASANASIAMNNIAVSGSFKKSNLSYSANISGDVSISCNGQNYLTCSWPSPVPLNSQSAVLAGCSGLAIAAVNLSSK